MRIAIHPDAEEALSAAVFWYQNLESGLDDDSQLDLHEPGQTAAKSSLPAAP